MKKALIWFLRFMVSNQFIFLKLKDTVFSNPAEHLFRITDYAKGNLKTKLNLPILDIGAADGATASYFSKNFNKATVIAFEPIEKMYKIAVDTNAKNANVTIRNLALSDSIGKKEIHITTNYLSSSLNSINDAQVNLQPETQKEKFRVIEKQIVATSTLDLETIQLQEILLIKIDTQGSELIILENGIETLKKTHLILIEMNNHDIYQKGSRYFEVDQFLRENNFKLIDLIITYRPNGRVAEYDSIYERIQQNDS
jgi:FkbM family methyltransferase